MRLAQIGGGLVGGALALKFVPAPMIVLTIFVALSYLAVRALLRTGRWFADKISEIQLPALSIPSFCPSRRMAEIMAMADERILELKHELALAEDRVRELEGERDGLRREEHSAVARLAELQRELQLAQAALAAAGAELRSRPAGEDPLYHRVGLSKDAPTWLVVDCRKAFRRRLHPDGHPPHQSRACHEG